MVRPFSTGRVLALFLVIGIAVGFRFATAQTPTPISACGNISGSVILTANLTSTSGECLHVSSTNTTIDGNGHTISVSGAVDNWAVVNTLYTNLTIQNLTSNQGVYLYGSADTATIQTSSLGNITVAGADDITIDHNTLGSLSVYAIANNPPYRTHVTNNTISGNSSTLVDFNGSDGTTCPPTTNFVISDNTITSTYQCGTGVLPACNEPKALFMRCAAGNTVTGNIIQSTGQAMPVRFRDAFDDSTVSDNTFWASGDLSPDGAFGAFNVTSGNVDKHLPQNNIFTRNLIRADNGVAMWNQAEGPNNTYTYNTFWASSSAYVAFFGDAPAGNMINHNTFYNAGSGSVLSLAFRNASVDTFINNIFSYNGSAVYGYDGWAFSRYVGNNNLFQNRGGSVSFGAFGSSLSAWQANAAPDDANSIEANPLFVNAGALNFSLQNGSPAIGTASDGTNIGAAQAGGACIENWSCGSWGACTNGSQSRTCTDANTCGTTTNRPPLSQSCDSTAPAAVTDLQGI